MKIFYNLGDRVSMLCSPSLDNIMRENKKHISDKDLANKSAQ